jgi:hypothetical protein
MYLGRVKRRGSRRIKIARLFGGGCPASLISGLGRVGSLAALRRILVILIGSRSSELQGMGTWVL